MRKSESDDPEHRVCTDFCYQKSITTGLSQVRDIAVFRVAWMYYSIDLMIYPEGVSVYKIDFFSGRWLEFVVLPADDRTGWDSACTTFYMSRTVSRRSCAVGGELNCSKNSDSWALNRWVLGN